jgi:hypothetical protein
MRIATGLAVFLAVAGVVYALTAREWQGTVLLLVCAAGSLYIGLVLRGAAQAGSLVAGEAAREGGPPMAAPAAGSERASPEAEGARTEGAVAGEARVEGAARAGPEQSSPETEHVGPTIWPFVFSLAALLLVVGLVEIHWILIPGAILFVGAAAGWFVDIRRQHHPSSRHHSASPA